MWSLAVKEPRENYCRDKFLFASVNVLIVALLSSSGSNLVVSEIGTASGLVDPQQNFGKNSESGPKANLSVGGKVVRRDL